jgi:hypothetical protein
MTHKWELQFIAIIALSGGLGGCAGKLRESDGTVHDNRFAVKQATAMTLHAPLLIPFVPLGEANFAVKALEENGKIELSGVVVGEDGLSVKGVSLTVVHASVVTFDLNDGGPLFWEVTKTEQVNGHFSVNLLNTHTVQLRFAKNGYDPREYHFEIFRKGHLPLDVVRAATAPVYGIGRIIESELQVVMKREIPTAAAITN